MRVRNPLIQLFKNAVDSIRNRKNSRDSDAGASMKKVSSKPQITRKSAAQSNERSFNDQKQTQTKEQMTQDQLFDQISSLIKNNQKHFAKDSEIEDTFRNLKSCK